MHAKTFVADGVWSSIGTMNFDNRSLALNDEATLMVLDHSFAQQMETMFRNDLERATPVDTAAFSSRSIFEHVKRVGC